MAATIADCPDEAGGPSHASLPPLARLALCDREQLWKVFRLAPAWNLQSGRLQEGRWFGCMLGLLHHVSPLVRQLVVDGADPGRAGPGQGAAPQLADFLASLQPGAVESVQVTDWTPVPAAAMQLLPSFSALRQLSLCPHDDYRLPPNTAAVLCQLTCLRRLAVSNSGAPLPDGLPAALCALRQLSHLALTCHRALPGLRALTQLTQLEGLKLSEHSGQGAAAAANKQGLLPPPAAFFPSKTHTTYASTRVAFEGGGSVLGVVTRLDLRRCSASLARDGSSSLAHVMRRATAQMPLLREIGVWDCDLSSGLEAAPLAALAKLSIRGCRLRGLPDALPVAGLRDLVLSGNQLLAVPPVLAGAGALRQLDANPRLEVTEEDLDGTLLRLPHLRQLWLEGTGTAPEVIATG
ncbi:hypothetical protein CHLNCDRAFT_144113 [Chlorella variabilis]|uniref:Uncharacterized protein n=1 Tax=Chlorella variabilis TaxID=554065 RepID=E1ZBX8_CHLVA|nr:hypothetical protein CHLNCDRAFT_144113 [Chlorella variabilis]EFN56716.1 hypothetical protein CHLNCDRAFT_144113 [Chlorella variabilis]|eukprot:XP_005848818.1 hypothetical protein CHLNCDRAFT_144113 [Chlorella variabilis]